MAFMTQQTEGKQEGKQNQAAKIVLLLILVGVFGYIYFFTSLIRPDAVKDEAKEASPPPQMVKKPIPAKGDGAAADAEGKKEQTQPSAAPAAKGEKGAPPAAQVGGSSPPAPKKEPAVTAPPPTSQPSVSQSPPPQAPPKAGKSAQAPTQAAKSAQPPPQTAKSAQTPPPQAQPAPAPKAAKGEPKKESGDGGRTGASSAKSARKPVVPPVQGGAFALSFGEIPEGAVLNDLRKSLAAARVAPVTVKPVSRTVTVHRLLVGERPDHDEALRDVSSLRKKKIDAFMGEAGDRYRVYAGSYLYRDRADAEVRRLETLGVKTTVVTGEASLKLMSVTAGAFPDRESAERKKSAISAKGFTVAVVERK